MLVHRFLEESARRSPDATALIEPSRSITYAGLDRLVNRAANLFRAERVGTNDRVVIALENSIEAVALYLGAMRAGAVAVPLPGGPRNDRLGTAVADCTPALCVVEHGVEDAAGHPLGRVPRVLVQVRPGDASLPPGTRDVSRALAEQSDDAPGVRRIDLDLAAIIYTSGSTGAPRGVMLTHRNVVANTRSIVEYLRLTERDRVMCVLPFYYVYGLSLLHTHLAVGGSVVIDNRFAFPSVVLKAMREHAVTGFAGVPSTFALLLQRGNLHDLRIPSLRYVTQAGGAMPGARILEWCERGPRVPFYVMYGATEASARLTYLDPSELPRRVGSIGRAIPNVEIRVLNEDGSPAAPGEIGELVARGANISCGYWNDPEETNRRFGPQGYRTGDLGYADEDGFLFLVGRRHDMIKVGAHRVGPKEIEDVLHNYPAVGEAAVVGAPHDILGEVPIAFVTLRSGASAEAVQAYCRQRLPPHKVPARVIVQSELPKLGAVGKIDRVTLRRLAADPAQAVNPR